MKVGFQNYGPSIRAEITTGNDGSHCYYAERFSLVIRIFHLQYQLVGQRRLVKIEQTRQCAHALEAPALKLTPLPAIDGARICHVLFLIGRLHTNQMEKLAGQI